MKKEHRALISILVVSGILGVLALMLDQYAIQQETPIRTAQLETDKNYTNSIFMKNYSTTSTNIELIGGNYHKTVLSRFMIIKNPKLNFLNEHCDNKEGNNPPCIPFKDNLENLEKDFLRFISVATFNSQREFNDLILVTGEIEGAQILLNKYLKTMDSAEQSILTAEDPNILFNIDEEYLKALDYLGQLRVLVDRKSANLDSKVIELKKRASDLMTFRQKLLLMGVFFQISSLVCLLYFFRKFLILIRSVSQ